MNKFTPEEFRLLSSFLPCDDERKCTVFADDNQAAKDSFLHVMQYIERVPKERRDLHGTIHVFVNEVPLEDMPLYINHPGYGPYAKWRLQIGK